MVIMAASDAIMDDAEQDLSLRLSDDEVENDDIMEVEDADVDQDDSLEDVLSDLKWAESHGFDLTSPEMMRTLFPNCQWSQSSPRSRVEEFASKTLKRETIRSLIGRRNDDSEAKSIEVMIRRYLIGFLNRIIHSVHQNGIGKEKKTVEVEDVVEALEDTVTD